MSPRGAELLLLRFCQLQEQQQRCDSVLTAAMRLHAAAFDALRFMVRRATSAHGGRGGGVGLAGP